MHTPPTVHVCNHPITYHNSDNPDFFNHISTVINKIHSKGLLSLQINTDIQNDSGANRSVTTLKNILHDCRDITPYPIGGINTTGLAIHCIGF